MNFPIFRRRAEDVATIARLTEALAESKTQCDARDDRIAMLERELSDVTRGVLAKACAFTAARDARRLQGRRANGEYGS
jgi:uncharacterized coiled-coil protein SlyX